MNYHEPGQSKVAIAFGRALRKVRKEKGLSQEKLAESALLHRTTISLFERGLKTPSLDSLFCLAEALNQIPSFLVELTQTELEKIEHEQIS